MDTETERRLAAMIMEEASRLRTEAERDGVAAYLAKPKVRGKANPQFLQATVRNIQQSNRIVEVKEMWRRRNVELEIEQGRKSWRRHDFRGRKSDDYRDFCVQPRHRDVSDSEDVANKGLKDEELDEFLHSRIKRGRGAVGARMDETGPYLPHQNELQHNRTLAPDERMKCEWEDRIVGPTSDNSVKDLDPVKKKKKQRSEVENRGNEDFPRSKDRKDRKQKDRHSKKRKRKAEKSSKERW